MIPVETELKMRRGGKTWRQRQWVKLLYLAGKGNELLMVCSPDDPCHTEAETLYFEMDGQVYSSVATKDVYDHPIKTIEEWLKEWRLE